MKFTLNSATDTLPHNSNLVRWYRGTPSNACKLCGQKQTLVYIHILVILHSNCVGIYNRRHDQVVGILAMAQEYLPNPYKITADLEDNNYTFPSRITPSNLQPDIVLWSDEEKTLLLIELTMYFETGFDEASDRRYADLAEEAHKQGYSTQTLKWEVGGLLTAAWTAYGTASTPSRRKLPD